MWTYDFLLKEAKEQWNDIIKAQCNLLGIEKFDLIPM
jgi:hypothetical protein